MVVEGTTLGSGGDEANGSVRTAVSVAARSWDPRVRGDGQRYSWLEAYLVRLDGKEARGEYHARLEQGMVGSEAEKNRSPERPQDKGR
jgi:hypothetical protein